MISTLAFIAASMTLASAQDNNNNSAGSATVCLNLESAAEATTFARGVQLSAIQKGQINAVCFDGGSLKLDPVPDVLEVFSTDPATISGKFTSAEGAVTPLRCEFPKDSVAELLKSVR